MEMCLLCVDKRDAGAGYPGARALIGDITGVRKAVKDLMVALPNQTKDGSGRRPYNTLCPYGYIGFREMYTRIWLRVTGWDISDYGKLTDLWDEGVDREKRRYCVPLERLQAIKPDLDVNRCLNLSDFYQPFLAVDEETGFILAESPPIEISGLVLDKATGDYLL